MANTITTGGSGSAALRVHPVRRPAQARAGRRGGDARLRALLRHRGRGRDREVGHRRPAPRLRLRAEPHRGDPPPRRLPHPARARLPRGDRRGDRLARRLHEHPARHAAQEGDLRLRRAGRLHRRVREGAAVEEDRRPAGRVGGEEAQGQGLRALGRPRRTSTAAPRRSAGRSTSTSASSSTP